MRTIDGAAIAASAATRFRTEYDYAIFGEDVAVVPKRDAGALAAAVLDVLAAPRRALPSTLQRIAGGFRLDGVADRYLEVYREATA